MKLDRLIELLCEYPGEANVTISTPSGPDPGWEISGKIVAYENEHREIEIQLRREMDE